jgi:hypothetical protein
MKDIEKPFYFVVVAVVVICTTNAITKQPDCNYLLRYRVTPLPTDEKIEQQEKILVDSIKSKMVKDKSNLNNTNK